MEELEVDFDSGLEEDELKQEAAPEDSTIFVAFKGNIGDRDFEQKLDTILENVPGLLLMGNVPSCCFSTVLKIFIYEVRVNLFANSHLVLLKPLIYIETLICRIGFQKTCN